VKEAISGMERKEQKVVGKGGESGKKGEEGGERKGKERVAAFDCEAFIS